MRSEVMQSNLYIMRIMQQFKPVQTIGMPYTIPDASIRIFRAKMIYEEAMETIAGLGVTITDDFVFVDNGTPDLEQIIDGVCDMDYVGTGALAACGVFDDLDHRREVCLANNRKFPLEKALFNKDGKGMKPEGWVGPDHMKLRDEILGRKILQ